MQNKEIKIDISKGTIEEANVFFQEVPEFLYTHPIEEFHKRLSDVPHLILSAYVDNNVVGMKIGYERLGMFYSWIGAVKPTYRGIGVAKALSDYQEAWARYNQYDAIFMKTRVRFHSMLTLNLSRDYRIIGFEEKDNFEESRILMKKKL